MATLMFPAIWLVLTGLTVQADPGPAAPSVRLDRHGDPLPPYALQRLGTNRFHGRFGIEKIAFVSKGKRLLGVGADGRCQLWDAQTGKEVRRFGVKQRTTLGRSAAAPFISPDGNYLILYGATDETIRCYEPETGKEIWRQRFKQVYPYLLRCAFSRDSTLAVLCGHRFLRVWETASGEQRFHLNLPDDVCLAGTPQFSPDGASLFALSLDGFLCKYSTLDGELQQETRIVDHPFNRARLSLTPDGGELVVVIGGQSPDGKKHKHASIEKFHACILNTETNALRRIQLPDDSGNGRMCTNGELIVLCDGKTVRVVETSKNKERYRFAITGYSNLHLSPKGRWLAFSNRLIDLRTGKVAWKGKHIRSIVFTSDELKVGVQSYHMVQVVDAATERPRHERFYYGAMQQVVFAANGEIITRSQYCIRHWDGATGACRRILPCWPGQILSCSGRVLLFSYCSGYTGDMFIGVQDRGTNERVSVNVGERQSSMALSPCARFIVLGDKIVDLRTKKLRRLLWKSVHHVDSVFPANGTWCARIVQEPGSQSEYRLLIFDASPEHRFERCFKVAAAPQEIAFSPCGRFVAVLCRESMTGRYLVSLHETCTGGECRRIEMPATQCSCIAVSRNGRQLAVGNHAGKIHLWSCRTNRLKLLRGHYWGVTTMLFSPDGKRLVSGSRGDRAFVWDVSMPTAAATPAAKEMETLWDQLGADAKNGFDAANALLESKNSVRFLARVLPSRIDRRQVVRRIADLHDDDFQTRAAAEAYLSEVCHFAESELRQALTGKPALEVSRRLERVLRTAVFGPLAPRQKRVIRAMGVLEEIGSPEATMLLEQLAHGPPNALSTREARKSLHRHSGSCAALFEPRKAD